MKFTWKLAYIMIVSFGFGVFWHQRSELTIDKHCLRLGHAISADKVVDLGESKRIL